MISYLIRRLLTIVPMIIFISVIMFIGLEITPGDPSGYMVDPNLTLSEIEEIREILGLNQPAYLRYFIWVKELAKGNLGYSMIDGTPIRKLLAARLPASIELASVALVISVLLGISLGMASALKQYSLRDNFLTVLGMIGISIPDFFFGVISILFFGLFLGILPTGGRLLPDSNIIDRLHHIILPASILGFSMTAAVMRYTRSAMLEVLNTDYMLTAKSKGLPNWRINYLHGLRSSMSPIMVLIMFRMSILVGGTVVIETVFLWPGMGRLFITAVNARDYPIIMVIALMIATVILFSSLILDIFVGIIDPRVRYR